MSRRAGRVPALRRSPEFAGRCAATVFAVLVAVAACAVAARAHEVSGPSARVIQRGRHLRVELRIDLAAFVARHAPVVPGTQPPPVEMLPALPEQVVAPMVEAARRALGDEVLVSIDGEAVAPQRVTLPSPADVQRLARVRAESGHALPEESAPAEIVVEILLPRSSGELSFRFGEEVGPLTASFSRPEVRYLAPGQAMTIPAGGDPSR